MSISSHELGKAWAHLIAKSKFFFAQLHAPSKAFRNAETLVVKLSGEFERNAAEA